MRQTATTEKVDPLMRIQEEIKEVQRREQEYQRLLKQGQPYDEDGEDIEHVTEITNITNNNNNQTNGHASKEATTDNENSLQSLSISPQPLTPSTLTLRRTFSPNFANNTNNNNNSTNTTNNTLHLPEENASNTPSLASSVNSKESLDEQHSDDSGISASFSPINGVSNNNNDTNNITINNITNNNTNTNNITTNNDHNNDNVTSNDDNLKPTLGAKEQRYIGPNYYGLTPQPPQQKLTMTRTVSTPHLSGTKATKPRHTFNTNPSQKGLMQRFFASRGKLQLKNGGGSGANSPIENKIYLNGKTAAALFGSPGIGGGGDFSSMSLTSTPTTPHTPPSIVASDPSAMIMPPTATASIERDGEGRPLRRGYVPVEVKIQRELKDLKSRESELKKIRKIRQSTSDLLESIEMENMSSDEEGSDVEHCYGPGKLRNAKSIGDMCDGSQSNGSLSPRATPSPEFTSRMHIGRSHGGGMRPAMSLAQLCDLAPEAAPSSHRLIAQWESLIQQNA